MSSRLVAFALAAASFVATLQAANAVDITIGVSDGGAIVPLASGTDTTVSTGVVLFNGFEVSASGAGNPPQSSPVLLNSTSIDTRVVGTSTGVLDVYVNAAGVTSVAGLWAFISEFTVLSSTADSLTLTTYVNADDGIAGPPPVLGVPVGTFGVVGVAGLLTDSDLAALFNAGAVEITALYHIVTSGVGQAVNAAIKVSAVPGPIVGAGLPGLLIACGALIALARRRRRVMA
jgi:hypothetical protein